MSAESVQRRLAQRGLCVREERCLYSEKCPPSVQTNRNGPCLWSVFVQTELTSRPLSRSPQPSPCRSWTSAAARCAWPWGRSVWPRSTRCRCPPPSRPTSSTSDAPPPGTGTTATAASAEPPAGAAPWTGVRSRRRKALLLLLLLPQPLGTRTGTAPDTGFSVPFPALAEGPCMPVTAPPWKKAQRTPSRPGTGLTSAPRVAWGASTCRVPG